MPREKGEGRSARQSSSSSSQANSASQANPAVAREAINSATPPVPANNMGVNNWDRGYHPNANWQPTNGSQNADEWASYPGQTNPQTQQQNGHPPAQSMDYEQSFGSFNPHQGFQHPAPVAQSSDHFNGNGTNGFSRPRPSPQPVHGGFSPHMTSPHPSPGGTVHMNGNGRSNSVPPHGNQQHFVDAVHSNGGVTYMNGSPFMAASPSPRPPSSNLAPPPPPQMFESNGNSNNNGSVDKTFRQDGAQTLTGHPNSNPGYPSPAPHQSSRNSNGYPGQSVSVKGELPLNNWEQHQVSKVRNIQHDELNSRLKEKILNKQQQQQCNMSEQPNAFQHMQQPMAASADHQHATSTANSSNQQYYMNYTPFHEDYGDNLANFTNGANNGANNFNEAPPASQASTVPTSTPSTTSSNVRLDVHVENQSSSDHFLATAHPQGGSGGGNRPEEVSTRNGEAIRSSINASSSSTKTPNDLMISPQDVKGSAGRADPLGSCYPASPLNASAAHAVCHHSGSTLCVPCLPNGQCTSPTSTTPATTSTATPATSAASTATTHPADRNEADCAESNENQRVSKLQSNIKDQVPRCQCYPPDQCKSPAH